MKKSITLMLICLIASVSVAQQKNITDDELNKFADAYQQVRMINQSSQQEMMKAVQDEELTVKRFNVINQAEQNPNKEVETKDDELEKYQAAMESVETIQAKIQIQAQTKIKESGLTIERFQQIANMIKTDKNLQQRLATLMQG